MTQDVTLSQVVAAEIRAEMGRQQKSAREVAEVMGVSDMYLHRRLAGKVSLTLADLERLAAALGVPATTFLPSTVPAAAA